jgi:hypothetical protein
MPEQLHERRQTYACAYQLTGICVPELVRNDAGGVCKGRQFQTVQRMLAESSASSSRANAAACPDTNFSQASGNEIDGHSIGFGAFEN